jgi:hypothetical protein
VTPTSDVAQEILDIMVRTIGRKTSEGYAVIIIHDVVRKLTQTHPCLRDIEIQNTRYIEFGSNVLINEHLNQTPRKEVGNALKDILLAVLATLRKSAGYFLIKEIRDRLTPDHLETLEAMGVDLNLLQFAQEFKKKEANLLAILPTDVVRRFLKTLLGIVETQTSREFAFRALNTQLLNEQQHHPFLSTIKISDIHLTLGSEEVIVPDSINTIEPQRLGAALEDVILGVNTMVETHGGQPIFDTMKTRLTTDYLTKLQTYGVNLESPAGNLTDVLTEVVHALIDIFSHLSTTDYAIHAINSFLHPQEDRNPVLDSITIHKTPDGTTTVTTGLAELNEDDVRHAILELLKNIVLTIGEKPGDSFIAEFRKTLQKPTLARIEHIGVNLHILSLQQEMREHKTHPTQMHTMEEST